MYYIVYRTTNLVNGKVYIGAHQTDNLEDGYLGSGYLLRSAIKKYGYSAFSREILFQYNSKEEMFEKERELVNEEFVSDSSTYNLKIGGRGGLGYHGKYHDIGYRYNHSQRMLNWWKDNQHLLDDRRDHFIQNKPKAVKAKKELMDNDPEFRDKVKQNAERARLLTLTEEAKQKRKETMKQKGHSQGDKNSQFGKIWIYNIETHESKSVIKTAPIPEGWRKGRKMNKEEIDDIYQGMLGLTQDIAKQKGYDKDHFSNKDRATLLEDIDDDGTEIVNPTILGKILNSYKQDDE